MAWGRGKSRSARWRCMARSWGRKRVIRSGWLLHRSVHIHRGTAGRASPRSPRRPSWSSLSWFLHSSSTWRLFHKSRLGVGRASAGTKTSMPWPSRSPLPISLMRVRLSFHPWDSRVEEATLWPFGASASTFSWAQIVLFGRHHFRFLPNFPVGTERLSERRNSIRLSCQFKRIVEFQDPP